MSPSNLRLLRLLSGFSLDELSLRTGLSASCLSRIERGYRKTTPVEVAAIEAALFKEGAGERIKEFVSHLPAGAGDGSIANGSRIRRRTRSAQLPTRETESSAGRKDKRGPQPIGATDRSA